MKGIPGKRTTGIFAENATEATAACLFAMTQGNLAAIGLGHLVAASQTGLLAATLASITLLLTKADGRLVHAILLGVVTSAADFVVHYALFREASWEAIITGIFAMALSYLVSTVWMTGKESLLTTRKK